MIEEVIYQRMMFHLQQRGHCCSIYVIKVMFNYYNET